jgi:predicted dehydrogenase
MAEFIDAILEGREPSPNGEDGRLVMQVVEEAYRSAGRGSPGGLPT